MKVLFVTRKFPPSVGGMENVARDLYAALTPLADVRLVAYGGKNKYLPAVYPWLLLRALWAAVWFCPGVVYVQDGVLAPLGLVLKWLLRRPVVVTIHGKELTYHNALYRRTVLPALARLSHAVVISEHTQKIAQQMLPRLKTTVVTWGVKDEFYMSVQQKELRRRMTDVVHLNAADLKNRFVLVTAGRLVRRKGVTWFVEQVMPVLARTIPNVLYVIAGQGEETAAIRSAIDCGKLADSVIMLGYVTDNERNVLLNGADLFVMPNIAVPGDAEGFGIVVLEASSCGTPIVAANLEGIPDAVIPGKTGWLMMPGSKQQYIDVVAREARHATLSRLSVRQATLHAYDWTQTARRYLEIFDRQSEIAAMKK